MNEHSIASWSLELLAAAKLRLEALGLDLAQAPEEARKAVEATHAALMSGMGVRGATYLVILLFVGVAVEWLYWTYAYSPLRALQATPAHSPLRGAAPRPAAPAAARLGRAAVHRRRHRRLGRLHLAAARARSW